MPFIDDKPNGIVLNHSADWSGEVRIAWYVTAERRDTPQFKGGLVIEGPTPPSLRGCWCNGPDLVAGRFTPVSTPPGEAKSSVPPVDVITRAVALAVEGYLRFKLERFLDVDLFINRGKLEAS